MFCFHKYEKRENDGYQYCSKCGKGRKLPCNHKWKIVKEVRVNGGGWVNDSILMIYECEFCGEAKQNKFN